MPIGADQLIGVRLAAELKVRLVLLILETHEVRLAQWQFPIGRETFALRALDVNARVTTIITEMELTRRAFLTQPFARVGVRRRLPSLGVQGRDPLVNTGNRRCHVLTLGTALAPLQFLNSVLSRISEILRS